MIARGLGIDLRDALAAGFWTWLQLVAIAWIAAGVVFLAWDLYRRGGD